MTARRVVGALSVALLLVGACSGRLVVEDHAANAGAGGEGGEAPEPTDPQTDEPPGRDSPADRWTENPPDCPATLPEHESSCSAPEGTVCGYRYEDEVDAGNFAYEACGCWETSREELGWNCYLRVSSPWECPETQPEHGADCFGHYGVLCDYPERTSCFCGEDIGWDCAETSAQHIPELPANLEGQTPVNGLGAGERAQWCDWYISLLVGEGYPEPKTPEVDDRGYALIDDCYYGTSFVCAATMPVVPRSMCESNLEVSTCSAPLSELTDCVLTVHDGCWPAPHGCARYLERSGCDGTIVSSQDPELLDPENMDPDDPEAQRPSCDLRVR